jgi:hypothetical protein
VREFFTLGDTFKLEFAEVAAHLDRLIDEFSSLANTWPKEEWRVRRAPGKWSRLEITGHLVDSARNNTERVVRALGQTTLEWPSYAQDSQVSVQHYHEEPPAQVLTLLFALNRHFAFVLRSVPAEKQAMPCTIIGWKTLPLAHLTIDYLAHFEHHLHQILENTGVSLHYSGLSYPLY